MKRKIPLEAFDYYVGLGVTRSYRAVADRYGASKVAVVNCAKREKWQERLDRINDEARRISDERAAKVVQGRCTEALRKGQVMRRKHMSMSCGCRIVAVSQIQFCTLHGAAPALHKALKLLYDWALLQTLREAGLVEMAYATMKESLEKPGIQEMVDAALTLVEEGGEV